MRYAKGIMWLDDCRIPFVETDPLQNGISGRDNGKMDTNNQGWGFKRLDREAGLGRFTPNLLVCDDMLNDGSVSKSGVYDNSKGETNGFHATSRNIVGKRKDVGGFDDKGTNSRYYDLDKWFDKIIDEIQ